MEIVSEHYGTREHENIKAIVVIDKYNNYGIKYIIDEKCEFRFLFEMTLEEIGEIAKYWCTGVINPEDLIPKNLIKEFTDETSQQ